MTRLMIALLLSATGLLAGCAGIEATRAVGMANLPIAGIEEVKAEGVAVDATPEEVRNWKVVDVVVNVPEQLKVSEANVFFPIADIVWHGDPAGESPAIRKVQVARILDDALTEAFTVVEGTRPVVIEVTLRRFHALTPKTRYTVGGTHDIRFDIVARDAETGETLWGPRFVHLEFPAYGGDKALEAERMGLTQKVRITRHLIAWAWKAFLGVDNPDPETLPTGPLAATLTPAGGTGTTG